jgi:hypothetical protein
MERANANPSPPSSDASGVPRPNDELKVDVVVSKVDVVVRSVRM